MRGRCCRGFVCVEGEPYASRANMTQLLKARPLTIRRFDADRYDRTLAMISAGGKGLSCAQIKTARGGVRRALDNGKSVAKACQVAAQ